MAQHDELQCDAQSIAYDFDRKTGLLKMVSGDCCDMSACVALFERIDPDVKRIDTFSGVAADTVYVKSGKHWNALTP